MTYCRFNEVLRGLRKSNNLTQQEFGAKVGLSKAVVSKYETGMGYPSFDVLIRIAKCYGVSTDYLLGVEGSQMLDVSGLNNSQLEIVRKIIQEFNKVNAK